MISLLDFKLASSKLFNICLITKLFSSFFLEDSIFLFINSFKISHSPHSFLIFELVSLNSWEHKSSIIDLLLSRESKIKVSDCPAKSINIQPSSARKCLLIDKLLRLYFDKILLFFL